MTASGIARRRRHVRAPGVRPHAALRRGAAVARAVRPALVRAPIGLVAWAIAADLILLATNDPTWRDVALVSGVGAVVAGALGLLMAGDDPPATAGGEAGAWLLRTAALGLFALTTWFLLEPAATTFPLAMLHAISGAALVAADRLPIGSEVPSMARPRTRIEA